MLFILHFFIIFIYFLPSFINERLHNILLMLAKSAVKHFLMAIVWLYGFESVFCQVVIDFVRCLFVVLFVTAQKTECLQFLIPSIEAMVTVHL